MKMIHEPWRLVRLFIGSTFSDMQAERDYVMRFVIPKLQEWCERRQLRLREVDLRWGVVIDDEAGGSNLVNQCLSCVDACRPLFVFLLGQRRGYVPSQREVPKETLRRFPLVAQHVGKLSITELEIVYALQLDLDEVTEPVATNETLGHQIQPFFYFRDASSLKDLERHAPQLRERYLPSITSGAHDPGFARWRGSLLPRLGCTLSVYSAVWQSDQDPQQEGRFTGFQVTKRVVGKMDSPSPLSLAEVMLQDLRQAIMLLEPASEPMGPFMALERELSDQKRVMLEAADIYVVRQGYTEILDQYVDAPAGRLLVLSSESGLGKSTLLANWVLNRSHPAAGSTTIHARFGNATNASASLDGVLRSLFEELGVKYKKMALPLPVDTHVFRTRIVDALTDVAAHGRTVLVIDGVDQISIKADWTWLPQRLPTNVGIIVSLATDSPHGIDLKHYISMRTTAQHLELSALEAPEPSTQLELRREVVEVFLRQYWKRAEETLIQRIIRRPAARNPLYLRILLEELRLIGRPEDLDREIDTFGNSPIDAFVTVCRRLEVDPIGAGLKQRVLTRLFFGFLAHAPRGLSVEELQVLIESHYSEMLKTSTGEAADHHRGPNTDHLEEVLRSYLYRLRTFLPIRNGVILYRYDSFRTAAKLYSTVPDDTYAATEVQWHERLARDLEARGFAYERTLRDYVFHAALGGDTEGIANAIDRGLLAAKRGKFTPADVDSDFRRALEVFEKEHDIARMILVAARGRVEVPTSSLFAQDGYLVWLGCVLVESTDDLTIYDTCNIIFRHSPGAPRLRMAAEFIVGLASHRAAAELRRTFMQELTAATVEADDEGLDMLAAIALKDVDLAFVRARAVERPKPKRLSRIFKLIRRFPSHLGALDAVHWLYDQRSNTWDGAFDALVAATGMLSPCGRALDLQFQMCRDAWFSRHDPTREASQLMSYLANEPRLLLPYIDATFQYGGNPADAQRALAFVAWFNPSFAEDKRLEGLMKRRIGARPTIPMEGNFCRRAPILLGHLGGLKFIYSSMHGYSWHAHFAIRVPILALWARLLQEGATLQLGKFRDIWALMPPTEGAWLDHPQLAMWSELGEAIADTGRNQIAVDIWRTMQDLREQPSTPNAAACVIRELVLLALVGMWGGVMFAVGVLVALLAIVFVAGIMLVANGFAIVKLLRLWIAWLRGTSCPAFIVRDVEAANPQGSAPLWLHLTNTWNWQAAAVCFHMTGRGDLAVRVLSRRDYGNLVRELRPWCFRRTVDFDAVLISFKEKIRGEQHERADEWLSFVDKLQHARMSRDPQALFLSGARLISTGQLRLQHVIKVCRRFTGKTPSVRTDEEIDLLGELIGRTGGGDGRAGMNDFVDACRALKGLQIGDRARLSRCILEASVSRDERSFSEVIVQVAHLARGEPTVAPMMRTEYLRLVGAPFAKSNEFINLLLFTLSRAVRRLMRLVLPNYSQPFDLIFSTVRGLLRRLAGW